MTTRIILSFVFLSISFSSLLAQEKWFPISSQEIQSKAPQVDQDADAEVIFWEVRVEDRIVERVGFVCEINHYLRIKILTDKGREDNATVKLGYGKIESLDSEIEIKDIEARTIQPSGKILELGRNDIFETDLITSNDVKLKAKGFAFPGIEKGSVIEYKWTELRKDFINFYVSHPLSKEIPVRRVKYYLKPVNARGFDYGTRIHTFNERSSLKAEPNGFYSIEFRDIPAFRTESFMPPERTVRPWILVYYVDDNSDRNITPDDYWRNHAKQVSETHKELINPKKEVIKKAKEIVVGAAADEERVRRIFEFCQNKIVNVDDDAAGFTSEQRAKLKPNKKESDILKNMRGNFAEITHIFVALVNAVGIKSRMASVSLRTNPSFKKELLNTYTMTAEMPAVFLDGNWRYFEPAIKHLPFGMMRWSREGQKTLLLDDQSIVWGVTPISKPEQNKINTEFELELTDDLEFAGTMRLTLTGHRAETVRESIDALNQDERKQYFESLLNRNIMGKVEVQTIEISGMDAASNPLVIEMRIGLKEYGEVTGRRFFMNPNIYESKLENTFGTNIRKNDLFYPFGWERNTKLRLKYPAKYSLESSDPPASVRDNRGIGTYDATRRVYESERVFEYEKKNSFGNNEYLEFGSSGFAPIKQLFDGFHDADQRAIAFVKAAEQ
ncbi:MAG: DUF3857 domain-containing protein [Pyrinomonadaceae bacterium]